MRDESVEISLILKIDMAEIITGIITNTHGLFKIAVESHFSRGKKGSFLWY
jgi:hypothetical protein